MSPPFAVIAPNFALSFPPVNASCRGPCAYRMPVAVSGLAHREMLKGEPAAILILSLAGQTMAVPARRALGPMRPFNSTAVAAAALRVPV